MKLFIIIGILTSFVFGWVGEITALKGTANIIRNNKTLTAKVGFKLEKNDNIKTLDKTKMQIIFKDNTIITIGKNSLLKISDYLFDDKNSKAKFRLSHGIMKTLTGKIGKFAPKRFKIRTKNASIGIRGTYFIVETKNDIVKLSMLSGITTFTNLNTMKTVEVKKGEQLIFNTNLNKIVIKPNFIEPNTIKFNQIKSNKNISSAINNIESTASDIENNINKNIKPSTFEFKYPPEYLKDLY